MDFAADPATVSEGAAAFAGSRNAFGVRPALACARPAVQIVGLSVDTNAAAVCIDQRVAYTQTFPTILLRVAFIPAHVAVLRIKAHISAPAAAAGHSGAAAALYATSAAIVGVGLEICRIAVAASASSWDSTTARPAIVWVNSEICRIAVATPASGWDSTTAHSAVLRIRVQISALAAAAGHSGSAAVSDSIARDATGTGVTATLQRATFPEGLRTTGSPARTRIVSAAATVLSAASGRPTNRRHKRRRKYRVARHRRVK